MPTVDYAICTAHENLNNAIYWHEKRCPVDDPAECNLCLSLKATKEALTIPCDPPHHTSECFSGSNQCPECVHG
jgi:hypothetical protein